LKLLLAISLMAALWAFAALPASAIFTCEYNDDYDQCTFGTSSRGPEDVGSEPEGPWYEDCDSGDGCR
jgi:hypothetical protein